MPSLTINGRTAQVEPGTTILAVADRLGIEIPTLCFLKGLDPATHCMLCVVRVSGANALMPACATLVTDGMQVTTDDPDIRRARQTGLELLLSDHPHDCLTCDKAGACSLQDMAYRLGIQKTSYKGKKYEDPVKDILKNFRK